ncbi:7921_t:CDS:2 [Ambispora gerdemannii]|uniref:7921_t:CDS:1 n=1 Tax=Ambispora gerdemannii TaxID=144530 RepID=A0A9N9DL31_9GLOM|nr:7921_t:CDS:2 [Ambispora gerdemannii]
MSSCKVICECIDCIEKSSQGKTVALKTYKKHLKKYQIEHEINIRLGATSLETKTKKTKYNSPIQELITTSSDFESLQESIEFDSVSIATSSSLESDTELSELETYLLSESEIESKKSDSDWENIDRLRIQLKDPNRAKTMLYRSTYQFQEQSLNDIYDGELYKNLLHEEFFIGDHDICLIGSCDGYQIFKQKRDDCWVVLFINGNLPPLERVKQENLMVGAIIPGPNAPKNMNKYLDDILTIESLSGSNQDNQIQMRGVTPAMYKHWSGTFFSKTHQDLNTDPCYYLKNSIWKTVSLELFKNSKKMPRDFGRVPVAIHHHKGYKAEEWMNWTILYSIPLLKNYLPSSMGIIRFSCSKMLSKNNNISRYN